MKIIEITIGVIVFAIVSAVLIEFEATETFYEFTRDHEDWELDELILVCLGLATGLIVTLILNNFRQIKTLKENQNALVQSRDEARRANNIKSAFLAKMSHEVRTPLHGMLGLTELLLETRITKKQGKWLAMIQSTGETLHNMLGELLDLAQIEKGELVLEDKSFALSDIIASLALEFDGKADDKRLYFELQDKTGGKLFLRGDPRRLRQVLADILDNAIKFTNSGQVSLIIEPCAYQPERFSTKKTHCLKFSVVDTGIGIEQTKTDQIFDSFQQAEEGITRTYDGVGLGLSICREILNQMGGSIEVESIPDRGTTFKLFVPFFEVSEQLVERSVSLGTSRHIPDQIPLNILVAEDNMVNSMLLKAMLLKAGHKVVVVENGKLAVEEAAKNWADIILMDIHMPEMDGVEATELIRATDDGKDLPIIAVTADTLPENRSRFLLAGINLVLSKPYRQDQILRVLERYRPAHKRVEESDESSEE